MGDRGFRKAYMGQRTGMYLPTKYGCDRSIVVGCRSRNDQQTDKQNGMTIRLTLCECDATDRQTDRQVLNNEINNKLIIILETILCFTPSPSCRLMKENKSEMLLHVKSSSRIVF